MKSHFALKLILILSLVLTASFHINAQNSATSRYNFLQDIYNQHNKKLYDLLILEINQFTNDFEDCNQLPDAYYLLAKVYEEKGDKHEALATCFKTIFLYPDSSKSRMCSDLARSIISKEKKYQNKQQKLISVLENNAAQDTLEYPYFDYIAYH